MKFVLPEKELAFATLFKPPIFGKYTMFRKPVRYSQKGPMK